MDSEAAGNFWKMEIEKVKENSAVSIQHCVQEPINAIALNKDCSLVVIAGRQVFKIFSIGEETFEEKANFRVGKNINLNYSAADVTWNHIEENKIASAATNSSVVVWDLNKPSRSKLCHVYTSHKRTVNRVTFHNKEPNLLLSGSQDGDMKIFDIRRNDVSTTFSAKESVRDVQFCPQSSGYFRFAAGLENGIVQEWDIRRPDRPDREITAHTGPVFTLDWNPMDKNWLATGGRDRAIKVWDIPSKKLVHIVHTMASVARCKWRPEYKHLIASSSLLVDFAVNVWDIRRPYIPIAAFNRHKDVASGIQWRNSANILLSCGRDGYLYQNIFKEAQRPLEQVNRVGVNISMHGEVAQAVCEHLLKPCRDQITEMHEPSGHHFYFDETSPPSVNAPCNLLQSVEPYMWANSNLYLFSSTSSSDLSMDWFVNSAKMYRLSGKSFEDICDHNASVAQKLNRKQVYLTWMILKTLYTCTSPNNLTPPYHPGPGYSVLSDKPDTEKSKMAEATPEKSCEVEKENPAGENTSGCSEEESEPENETIQSEKNLANIATGLANQTGDFFFGDGDTDFSYDLEDADNVLHDKQDWSLPAEAFQPRHELEFGMAPPVPMPHYSPASANDSDGNSFHATASNHKDAITNGAAINDLYINVKLPSMPQWDCTTMVTGMLTTYAEQEDIQSTVSMLIVLGDRIQPEIDLEKQTSWFLGYIELLGQFQLWSVMAEVIKLSKIPEVAMLNQQSSNILTMCHRCNKTLTNCSWFCNKCRGIVGVCSICFQPVKRLYVWCQGCSHGGHLQHIMDWFQDNKQCPRGCGHYCEFS